MSHKLYDLPPGFKVQVETSTNVKVTGGGSLWGFQDSENVQTNKATFETIKVLNDLRILQEDRTYLQISSQKSVTYLDVRLNSNTTFPDLSNKEVMRLKSFSSSGYLWLTRREKVPLRPATFRKDYFEKIVPLVVAEGVKPKMDIVGKWIVLDLLFPKNEQIMLTKMAIADIRFDIVVELLKQNMVTEQDIENYESSPSFWLEDLLKEN